MKPISLPITRLGFLLITILFSNSCHKTDFPYADPRNGKTDFRQCVIQYLDDGSQSPFSRHVNITYNNRRDPVKVEPPFVATGSPRGLFYYDKKGRMITYAGVYDNGIFEFWHNYQYDPQDRIIGDTNYGFGPIGHLDQALAYRYTVYTYDRLNRVISLTTSNSLPPPNQEPPFTITYHYDAAGNLDGDVTQYDDKINPLLTNKIWRFLARDYSVNNNGRAALYNDKGLPLHFTNSNGGGAYYNLWGIFGPTVNIQYDCQDDSHGGHY